MNAVRRCRGLAHHFSIFYLSVNAHPPIHSRAGSAGESWGQGGSLFLPWSQMTAAPGGLGLLLEPQPHPGRFSEEVMHAHGRRVDQPEIKMALTKKSQCLLSLSTCVNIWENPPCLTGWEEARHTNTPVFKGLKSIISDGCFLPGPQLWFFRSRGSPYRLTCKLSSQTTP